MNVLFLMADEFRYDVPGFMGNRVARTPHLDRLASRALVFDNAYTASPVCIPGRQCMATGRYPFRAGCVNFGEDIAPGSPTFARWFADHGYYTVACGKLHHRGPDPMQGWLHRIGAEIAVDWPAPFRDRRAIGRGKWRGAEDLHTAGPGISPLALHDDYSIAGALAFLKMHFGGMYGIPSDVPLLLMVSLQQPHFPFRTRQDLFDHYLDRVPVFDQDKPTDPVLARGFLGPEEGVTPRDVRRATAAYYGMVEQTDTRIGQVLAALEEAGQNLDEWIIVFTADHGDMLGQYGLWEKRKFYEGSARVPLFISAPGLSPGRSDRLCNLVDLFPTLSSLADLPAPSDIDGRDIFGPEEPGIAFSQYGATHFMVRSGSCKYLRLDGTEILFDLARDPAERTNLLHDPAYRETLQHLRAAFVDFLSRQEAAAESLAQGRL